jgi:hypothetical protein
MEDIIYDYMLTSPSGYTFHSRYVIKMVQSISGIKIPITGSLYVGKPKVNNMNEACTTITVNYPQSIDEFEKKYGRPSPINPTVASLILTKHYTTCARKKQPDGSVDSSSLIRGEGTKEMIMAALSLVKQLCPFIKEFDLNDASSKECANKAPITLPYFYITNKWQTWYEASFKAYLKPASLMKEYRNRIAELQSYPLDQFDIFKARYLESTSKEVCDTLQASYKQSNTIMIFFKKLYHSQSISMVCMLLQPWIDRFMCDMKFEPYIIRHKWYISIDNIPNYQYKNVNSTIKVYRLKNNMTKKRRNVWTSLDNPKKL